MKYYHFLYSRTIGRDYRWIVVPPFLSANALRILNEIYDDIEDHRKIINRVYPPLFCLKLPAGYILAQFIQTEFNDKDNRMIYSMQGLAVPNKNGREFWYCLPWLVINQNEVLNPWKYYPFEWLLDEYEQKPSDPLELSLDNVANEYEVLQPLKDELLNTRIQNEQLVLEYNENGYAKLIKTLRSSSSQVDQFAFGFSPRLKTRFKDFSMVAVLQTIKSDPLPPPIPSYDGKIDTTITLPHHKNPSEQIGTLVETDTCVIKIIPSNQRGWLSQPHLQIVAEITTKYQKYILYRIDIGYSAKQIVSIQQNPTQETLFALNKLVDKLVKDGWHLVYENPGVWWDKQFRKYRRKDVGK